jgi:hypothetical protein
METLVCRRQKQSGKHRETDPFQVFCAENRPEVTAQHPHESVGAVTSVLAAMWRSMSTDKKRIYIELAKQFDIVQSFNAGPPKPRPIQMPKCELSVPLIHVVRRIGSSPRVQETSLHLLDHVFGEGSTPSP